MTWFPVIRRRESLRLNPRARYNTFIGASLSFLGFVACTWATVNRIISYGQWNSSIPNIFLALFGGGLLALGLHVLRCRNSFRPGNLVILGSSIVISLVLSECLLNLGGWAPERELFVRVPDLVDWWQCDQEQGCRYLRENLDSTDRCFFNEDGFRDVDEFRSDGLTGDAWKILLLGDSFAFGAAAVYDNRADGFGDILERKLSRINATVVWNTGIPGIGQKQELLTLKRFYPEMRPELVLLCLYGNDFVDNMFPMGMHYVYTDGKWISKYEIGTDDQVWELSPRDAYLRAVTAPHSVAEVLLLTRLGTAIMGLDRRISADSLGEGVAEEIPAAMVATTHRLLQDTRSIVESAHGTLIVMLIPSASDLSRPDPYYRAAQGICEDLSLQCIEVAGVLSVEDYTRSPDGHWTAAGHYNVGTFLTESLRETLASKMPVPRP